MALISQEVDAGKALYPVPSAGHREVDKFMPKISLSPFAKWVYFFHIIKKIFLSILWLHVWYLCSPRLAHGQLLMGWSSFHPALCSAGVFSQASVPQQELLGAEIQLCQLHHLQICPNEIWQKWSELLQTKWNCHMFLTAEMTVQPISHSSGWHASLDLQNGKEKPLLEATVLQAFTLFFHLPWNSNKLEALKDQPWTDIVCQLL